jgi:hypothetical protein
MNLPGFFLPLRDFSMMIPPNVLTLQSLQDYSSGTNELILCGELFYQKTTVAIISHGASHKQVPNPSGKTDK